eukprot:1890176-Pleurochrysis_carterae.AAC.2
MVARKEFALGSHNWQFPRCSRKSRQTVCVRRVSSSARSTSFAPSTPFATSSHALLSTASSCACVQDRHIFFYQFTSLLPMLYFVTYFLVSHLLSLFHV